MEVQFTNAFRSEIDLKAHKATAHTRSMRRMAARQARTLDIDFNLAPRPRAMHGRRRDVDHGNYSLIMLSLETCFSCGTATLNYPCHIKKKLVISLY